jgi:hypothetical protein
MGFYVIQSIQPDDIQKPDGVSKPDRTARLSNVVPAWFSLERSCTEMTVLLKQREIYIASMSGRLVNRQKSTREKSDINTDNSKSTSTPDAHQYADNNAYTDQLTHRAIMILDSLFESGALNDPDTAEETRKALLEGVGLTNGTKKKVSVEITTEPIERVCERVVRSLLNRDEDYKRDIATLTRQGSFDVLTNQDMVAAAIHTGIATFDLVEQLGIVNELDNWLSSKVIDHIASEVPVEPYVDVRRGIKSRRLTPG